LDNKSVARKRGILVAARRGEEPAMTQPASRTDQRGAVFVEKLIVYLPMLLAFFAAWELAELGAAHVVTQRACAAAGRAAMVVLGDDPAFYEDEPIGSFDGMRRADIELAAAMILSAVPRMSDDFSVEIAEEPKNSGDVFEVAVSASYDCGLVSLICGGDSSVELLATSQHTYHGAKYPYSTPALGGGDAALVGTFKSAGSDDDFIVDDSGPGFRSSADIKACKPGAAAEQFMEDYENPNAFGNKTDYGSGIGKEALRYRCDKQYKGGSDVAALTYTCGGQTCVIADQSGHNQSHAERKIVRQFQDIQAANPGKTCRIVKLYTELEPCDGSVHNCNSWLGGGNGGPGLSPDQVSYSYPYNPGNIDPRTHRDYRSGKQSCDRVAARARQCGDPAPPTSGCQAMANYARQHQVTVSTSCLEYLLAIEDFQDKNFRKRWTDLMAKEVKDTMAQKCSTIGPSPYGKDDECAKRSVADIDAEIAALQKKIDRLRNPPPGSIPITPEGKARRIAEYQAQIDKLKAEKAGLGG
jgi:hypothetical protein